jgi:hypothetical protein
MNNFEPFSTEWFDEEQKQPFSLFKRTSPEGKVTIRISKNYQGNPNKLNEFSMEYDPKFLKETLTWMKEKDYTVFES